MLEWTVRYQLQVEQKSYILLIVIKTSVWSKSDIWFQCHEVDTIWKDILFSNLMSFFMSMNTGGSFLEPEGRTRIVWTLEPQKTEKNSSLNAKGGWKHRTRLHKNDTNVILSKRFNINWCIRCFRSINVGQCIKFL